MSIESDTELRVQQLILSELEANVPDYVGGDYIKDEIRHSNIRFFPVSGPAGVGKTAITSLGATIRPDVSIHLIDTKTNRPGKASDPEGFRTAAHGVTLQSLHNDIVNAALVNYMVIKKTGFIYATEPSGFRPGINIGPIVADNIQTFLKYDFDELTPIYVISPVEMWSHFMQKSMGERPDLIADRAEENIDSLLFAKRNIDLFKFIENRDEPGGLEKAANNLVAIATHGSYPIIMPEYAENRLDEMIVEAKRLYVQ
jgi:hypothetical protein